MTDKNGIGVTVISHDCENRTYATQGYSCKIHYTGTSLPQLASLTRVSSHCEQFIKYECYHSGLWLYNPTGWWVSRDSNKMNYWGGASPGSGKCACGMTYSCADSSEFGCNCDKNDHVWREDSGLLTDKTTLPVEQLYFGDLGGFEKGYHTVGKLKCYGTAWTYFNLNDLNSKSRDVKSIWHCCDRTLFFLKPQICNSNLKSFVIRTVLVCEDSWTQEVVFVIFIYFCLMINCSGTRLIRTLRGHAIVSVLSGCPY